MQDSMNDAQPLEGHAYHYNLPSQFMDTDGVPLTIKYANRKARNIVEAAFSIQLSEDLFLGNEGNANGISSTCDPDNKSHGSFDVLIQNCNRLSSSLTALRELKHGGISQKDLCRIVIHILRLLSATVVPEKNGNSNKIEIHYDDVGFLYDTIEKKIIYNDPEQSDSVKDITQSYLEESFALPSPARESLLSVLISLLTSEDLLRSASNTSFRAEDVTFDTPYNGGLLMVLNWKAILRMLLRTAPYLDERKSGGVQLDPVSRQSTVLKRTVLIARYLRRFYDQGLDVKDGIITDKTANEVWEMVHADLRYQTHTNASYRALIMLYLFQPSRCSRDFYMNVMPIWLDSWTSIDRCPDNDFLWLTMFCRARKYVGPEDYDWESIRRRLLTLCGYWLQIPVGGVSSDKSFPNAAQAKSRSIPARLKSFIGNGSSYQEGVDFVSKLSKLLMFCLGKNDQRDVEKTATQAMEDDDAGLPVSDGTEDLLRFLSFVAPYFHPSNTGAWTFPLGVLLHYMSFELCRRLGRGFSQNAIAKKYPNLALRAGEIEPYKKTLVLPGHEIVLILDALLPLCQQALYSKSARVARAGESALLYLTQIDHKICPMFLDFAMRALDISSVTLSHQAPAALSALSRLVQPSLKTNPCFFLERLPEILRLTLAGIDSNDEDKTIRTLIFYRTLTSWIPIGKSSAPETCVDPKGSWIFGEEIPETVNEISESNEYWAALRKLPHNSLLYQAETSYEMEHGEKDERLMNLVEESAYALGDWSLSFLERIFDILRAAGEQEKVGKSYGIASRHSSADASQAKHFTMLLKQCLSQVFAAMDDKILQSATRSVEAFLQNETLPLAVKYASILCEAVCRARMKPDGGNHSPGLDMLLPLLAKDLSSKSKTTVLYRTRCVAGAVRQSGRSMLNHRESIFSVLQYTLQEQNDKKIFKAGCKVLRHLLSSQCESYPFASDSCSRLSESIHLGKPSHLMNDRVSWHVPTGEQINFVAEILSEFSNNSLKSLSALSESIDNRDEQKVDLGRWRNCLKILRYTLRGSVGIFPEIDSMVEHNGSSMDHFDPNEIAICALLNSASTEARNQLSCTRGNLSQLIANLLALIANGSESAIDSADLDTNKLEKNTLQKRSVENIIASDVKICSETIQISILLSTRRGAPTNCQDAKSLWKLQKGLASDRMLSTMRQEITTVVRKAGHMNSPDYLLYNDGEEGGKSFPRRMLSTRVYIFLQSIQRQSSFEIPRRLRRKSRESEAREKAHDIIVEYSDFRALVGNILNNENDVKASQMSESNLNFYEDIIDGSFALACHTNAQIRSSGYRLVEHLFTRFGWFAKARVERLLSALSLNDRDLKGKYGLLSSASLSSDDSASGKKRLAEVLKGVANLLHLGKIMKEIVPCEKHRLSVVQSVCRSQRVTSLLPTEEIQKMTHYYHGIYSKFRSKQYSYPRKRKEENDARKEYQRFLLGEFRNDGINANGDIEANSAHWKDRLTAAWFLLVSIDQKDIELDEDFVVSLWETCFMCLEKEAGQPLQKLTLGLIGRLCTLYTTGKKRYELGFLRKKLSDEDFCVIFAKALVYNHKEDKSIGGGHKAQWSVGVESMLRDSQSNIAPRTIFPFKRMGRSSGNLIIQHMQLLSCLLNIVGKDHTESIARHFLSFAKILASSLPSEDQRNQLSTSAEIFGGIAHGLISVRIENDDISSMWESFLLPVFDAVMDSIPSSALAAYTDALRFIIQNLSPRDQMGLIDFVIQKIDSTLWKRNADDQTSSNTASDGFAEQSKWVGIMCAILVELDNHGHTTSSQPWYKAMLSTKVKDEVESVAEHPLQQCWSKITARLLPRILDSLGHPYQKCREQIAWCLFNMCNCNYKILQQSKHSVGTLSADNIYNPGEEILKVLSGLGDKSITSTKEQQLCLTTARFFIFYCLHYGDNKNEYADFILPLLPMAFEAIKPDGLAEDQTEVDSELRMLQAQVLKGYRYSIAEISASCFVTYNNTEDITKVLKALDIVSHHDVWQVRHTAAHFLRCFQGCHKFLFTEIQTKKTTRIVSKLLADDRKEVSAAAMSALTGILASTPSHIIERMVEKYIKKANNSVIKKKKVKKDLEGEALEKEFKRATKQQTSVYFLCAAVLSRPYDTPKYVPKALAALSRHSYERTAPFTVREAVKLCCREFKRTHMTDNWELHKQQFSREELEALNDVVSTPHYYA